MNDLIQLLYLFFKNIPHWIQYGTLKSFEFEKPWILSIILVLPFLFLFKWLFNFRFRNTLALNIIDSIKTFSLINYLRFLPDLVFFLFLSFLLIALARPQTLETITESKSEGIDIMLAIDISQSMLIEDFKPNRLEVAKKVAFDFVKGRKYDKIGLTIFSGESYTLCPLTSDYELLNSKIESLNFYMIQAPGTVMGNAIASALNRLRETPSKSKVIILISDGSNLEGEVDPITAAKLCNAFNVKIYGIGVGIDGEVPFKDENGQIQYIKNTLDESTLKKIAKESNGHYFRASNKQALEGVFQKINQLEKSKVITENYIDTKDFYDEYLKIAIFLFLIWLFLKSTFVNNILED